MSPIHVEKNQLFLLTQNVKCRKMSVVFVQETETGPSTLYTECIPPYYSGVTL